MKTKLTVLFGTALTVLVADQLTKWQVVERLPFHDRRTITSFFTLVHYRNTGGAFGLMRSLDEHFRTILFLVASILAVGLILVMIYRAPSSKRLFQFSLSLVLGGAIGNLTDRIWHGYVVDFLEFHWRHRYFWPAFNVADIAITVGVGLLLIQTLFGADGEEVTSPLASEERGA